VLEDRQERAREKMPEGASGFGGSAAVRYSTNNAPAIMENRRSRIGTASLSRPRKHRLLGIGKAPTT
jgi:hypothetical protein